LRVDSETLTPPLDCAPRPSHRRLHAKAQRKTNGNREK
jgi:hypothetical protein